jgi:hypothetical protein
MAGLTVFGELRGRGGQAKVVAVQKIIFTNAHPRWDGR